MRTHLARVSAAVAAIAVAGSLPATAAAAPTCTTPAAADGHEPPCNPYLASPEWAASHRASYAQASSPFAGPRPGEILARGHLSGLFGIPVVVTFSDRYPDGGRAAWLSTVSIPDARTVYKVDVKTGLIIDSYDDVRNEHTTPQGPGGISGAYSVLDRDNNLIVGRGRSLDVYGDARPGEHLSPIKVHRRFRIPDSVFCRSTDKMVGITLLFDGRVAFASEQGVVGVLPREPQLMSESTLETLSLNGSDCADPAVPDADLEQVSNSIAADEDGGVYVVTDEAMHKLTASPAGLQRTWTGHYETGAGSGVRLGDGSGSTPTLMGTAPGDDRFVVITDGRDLMHLVLMWRDEIPADWQPIAPGKDRRIACEVPVTFGNPNATESLSEQSVMVRGNAAVVVNNKLGTEDIVSQFGAARIIVAPLAGQDPLHAPYGLERIDWDPRTRTCRSVWANAKVSIPNGIPTMSAATNLIYGVGQRAGVWGLEGIDFSTGASRLFAPASPSPDDNSFYAATTIGPDRSIWTGTFTGLTVYRPVASVSASVLGRKVLPRG